MEEATKILNQEQKEASDAFFEFLFSQDKEFIISGSAGVGKTFLMSHFIDNIMPQYHQMCKLMDIKPDYNDVVMTATTNKAAEVLQESTKRPTQTIHSFMNLKVTENYNTGKTNLQKTTAWYIHTNKIIFIDECSMIDSDLYKLINEGTHGCKIIYVGDHNQLAPVFEDISPIYKTGLPMYELTQQMRNAGQPALMALCAQLREQVETGVFKPIKIVPGVIDLLSGQEMQDEINSQFLYQTLDKRILAYTNKRVIQYNDHVRAIRQLPDSLTTGELVVNNSAIKIKSRMIPVECGIEIISNKGPSIHIIENDVKLNIDIIDFKTSLGEYFTDVSVPTDRSHFNALVKYYANQKNWDRMFYLKNNFPDLRARDAATVHKAQGSTYESVFIDLDNISTCNFTDQVARMLYVAFSRAKNHVYLYGELASKYGGLTY